MRKNKSKAVAAVLAILFGGFGVHRFYLGENKAGILMFLFSWTFVPAIIAWVDFFKLIFMDDGRFDFMYNTSRD